MSETAGLLNLRRSRRGSTGHKASQDGAVLCSLDSGQDAILKGAHLCQQSRHVLLEGPLVVATDTRNQSIEFRHGRLAPDAEALSYGPRRLASVSLTMRGGQPG